MDHAETKCAAAESGVGCAAVGAHTVVDVVGAAVEVVVLVVSGDAALWELEQPTAIVSRAQAARTHRIPENLLRAQSSLAVLGSRAVLASSSGAYDALVAAHVVFAVVGFGAVAISGVYGALARNPANENETSRYFASRGLAEWLIIPVPFVGLAALLVDHRSGDLTDGWVLGGSVVWVAATAILLAGVRPAEARIRRQQDPVRAGRVLMRAAVASDVLFVVALALMVTQPG